MGTKRRREASASTVDQRPFAPFAGAVEPPERGMSPELQTKLRVIATVFGGLAIIIIAVAAIVS